MSACEMHMMTFNSASSIRRFKLFGMVLSLLGLMISAPRPSQAWAVAPQAAECQSGIGGRIFSNGGELEVEMVPANAGFTVELHLVSPGPQRLIATNREPGAIVKLGSFPAGVELIFGVFVRDTQRTFVMGPGSGNPDGLPHAEVTCFAGNRANVGFEDQLGGGDSDYNDLLFTVRQPQNSCNYAISPASQSFGSGGGNGSVNLSASAGCSWSATSDVSWVNITSGSGGSDSGTINYSVALNTSTNSRTGTITLQGQTFTVHQDGDGSQPLITCAVRKGKKLRVYGLNFDSGTVILLNGEEQKTIYDGDNPSTVVIGKKVGNRVRPGDELRVRSSLGALSPEYTYTP